MTTPLRPPSVFPLDPEVTLLSADVVRAGSDQTRLRERFGDDGFDALVAAAVNAWVGALRLEVVGPFFWASGHAAPPQRGPFGFSDHGGPRRFQLRAGVVVGLQGAAALGDLLAAALPDVIADKDEIVRVLGFFGARVLVDRDAAIAVVERPLFDPRRGPRDQEPIRRLDVLKDPLVRTFEPPHFRGRAFVCTVDDHDEVARRVVVDADSLAVVLEDIGAYHRQTLPIPGGRGYVSDDGARVTAALTTPSPDARAPTRDATTAAAHWRQQGLFEHASVASFARSVLELMAAGAPLDLVARSLQAGLDEVRHADDCFVVAARFDGGHVDVGALEALAPRAGSRRDLARRALVEAAVPESIAAAEAARAADVCADEFVAGVLQRQADDEARHAALAFDVVAWACADVVDDDDCWPDPASLRAVVNDDDGDAVRGILSGRERAAVFDAVWARLRAQRAALAR